MPRTNIAYLLPIALAPLLVTTLCAGEPNEPIQPGADPNDWECTYAVSETTCGKLIDAWGRDTFGDGHDVVDGLVLCGGCTPITTVDHCGKVVTVGYHCDDTVGYEVLLDDRTLRVPVYAEAGNAQGWQVTDWNLLPCLRTWDCYDFCTFDREVPSCIAITIIRVGRFQPELAGPCKDEISPSDSGSDDSGGGDSSGGDSGNGAGDDSGSGSDSGSGDSASPSSPTIDPSDPSQDPGFNSNWY